MSKINYIIKYTPVLYNIYYYIMSFVLRVFGIFVKTNDKLILFNSFGGRQYNDSPKAIFESMIQDCRYDTYILVWALNEPQKHQLPPRAKVVNANSFSFFLYALKAKVWITNSNMEKGLRFKKKNTIYVNTWHGTPIKYLGDDVKKDGKSFKAKGGSKEDIFLCQGAYDERVFKRAFNKDNLYRYGLPRNDELVEVSLADIQFIKKRLNIDEKSKVILYAPTFREFTRSSLNEIVQDIPLDFGKWKQILGEDVIILFRAHYEVARYLNVEQFNNVIDVSDYQSLNELMKISDILISDYSSIYFDYSILHRPVACYAYDYNLYEGNRGLYLKLDEELPCKICMTESMLLDEIKNIISNYQFFSEKTALFQRKYVTELGNSSQKVNDELYSRLSR